MKKIFRSIKEKLMGLPPYVRIALFVIMLLLGGVIIFKIIKGTLNAFKKFANPFKGKLFGIKLPDTEKGDPGVKSTKITDRKVDRAVGKETSRFIKNPEKYNSRGVKRPPKDQKRIRKFMKTNNGRLPDDVERELASVTE